MKIISILSLFAIFTSFANESLQSQTKPIPVVVTCRRAILTRSYVLQIQNSSDETLNLWLQAKEKFTPFALPARKMVEFGWAQGYHFDANNLFLIGGDGYDTIKQVMPNVELSPWRIDFPKDGGVAVSLSQSYLQEVLTKNLGLPVMQNFGKVFKMELDQPPQVILEEGSDSVYANAVFQALTFSGKVRFPVVASVSFIPFYNSANGEISATQIRVVNIDMIALPKEWLDGATQIVNEIIPTLFSKCVIYKLDRSQLKIAKLINVHKIRVNDGRLEILIL